MTEKEMFLTVLKRLNFDIYVDNDDYLEFHNGCGGENISAEFDKKGNFVDIYC